MHDLAITTHVHRNLFPPVYRYDFKMLPHLSQQQHLYLSEVEKRNTKNKIRITSGRLPKNQQAINAGRL